MVVPVLITSCHVSEKLNNGPLDAQTSTTTTAPKNTVAEPAQLEIFVEIVRKRFLSLRCVMLMPPLYVARASAATV